MLRARTAASPSVTPPPARRIAEPTGGGRLRVADEPTDEDAEIEAELAKAREKIRAENR